MPNMTVLENAIAKRRTRRRLPDPRARRLLREKAGLSQQDLAEAVEVSRAAVSRWELGERNPRVGPTLDSYMAALERLERETS